MTEMHTDKKYGAELDQLSDDFTVMIADTMDMFAKSIHSFFSNDIEGAYQVIRQDDKIDQQYSEIDQSCVRLIARRQPLGPDLRLIMTIQKAIVDLERIADRSVNLAERTIELGQQQAAPVEALNPMTDMILSMLKDLKVSYEYKDSEKARHIIMQDRLVDAYYAQVLRQLMDLMSRESSLIFQSTRLLSAINNLERIGDHIKNIAEKFIYLITGENPHKRDKQKNQIRGVLFLCVKNSARSQIAEGWARKLFPASVSVYSAGSSPAEAVHPKAVEVMKEVGIDISQQKPKQITDVPLGKVDVVVTLCSEEICVNMPNIIQRRMWLMPDPVPDVDSDSQNERFQEIRDRIKENVEKLVEELQINEHYK